MADDTENHTVRLLQEMRREVREMHDDLGARINGLTHIITLLAGHSHNLEERVSKLEEGQSGSA